MLQLYLIRHADAVPHGDPNYADDDRPLTDLGRGQARALGEALAAREVRFDVILCSPLPRAKETVEALLTAMPEPHPPVEYADELTPGGKRRRIDRLVLKHGGTAVALVGHQPDLGEYTARLIGSKKAGLELAKAGIACVECADSPGKGCGALVALIPPIWFGAPVGSG